MKKKTINEIKEIGIQVAGPGQKVMIRRLKYPGGDGKEYRGRIVGISSESPSSYIVEMVDRIGYSEWSHTVLPASCLDNEGWDDDE